MKLGDLGWYWRRLSRMSPPEMLYRAQKTLRTKLESRGYLLAAHDAALVTQPAPAFWMPDNVGLAPDAYVAAAEAIINGQLDVFALKATHIGHPPAWNRDPKTGTNAPIVFGKTINYRKEAIVGDIKYLWEPSRHLQLVTLAQAFRLTKADRYWQALVVELESWLDQCPYPRGPHWISSLELGIRLINWSIVWNLVGGDANPGFQTDAGRLLRNRWLTSIHQHQHFIANYFSRFSSANNHLIGEAAGLFVAAATWPCWKQSPDWRQTAQGILEAEALRQNTSDGVNREQAISYQQFVLDFLLMPALVGKAHNIEFSSAYWQRIEKMLEFVAALLDVGGNMPMIGDADDGYAVRLSQESMFCPYRSLLATGGLLFGRADFVTKARHLDDKTQWLLGQDAAAKFRAMADKPAKVTLPRAFPEGGYYILGDQFDTPNEIKMVVDAGPLGYESIAAHGHADALAIWLSIAGNEVLIDPGTYAYHTQKTWRDYFRGTSAHNTVRIDGVDQSVAGGNFMWIVHAEANCESWSSEPQAQVFKGSHRGYLRLQDPVLHRRTIRFVVPERKFVVTDELVCEKTHNVELFWHFAERCDVTIVGRAVEVRAASHPVKLFTDFAAGQLTAVSGQDEPSLGWVSRGFDMKVPTTTVCYAGTIHGSITIVTEINCSER